MPETKDKAVKSIFRGASIVFAGTIISKLMGFAYRVLVGRYLGPADYGVISVMMAVFGAVTTIAFLGMSQGVMKYVSHYLARDDMKGVRGTIRTAMGLITASSIIVGTLLFVLAPWISTEIFSEPRAIWPIRFVALILPLRGYTQVFTSITNAYEEMQYQVITGKIWLNVVKVIVAAVLVYLGYGYLGAAAGYAIGFGSAAFVGFYFARKMCPSMLSPSAPAEYNIRHLLSHSAPLLASGVIAIITSDIDTFMLQFFKGAEDVGLYNAAYPFAALLTTGIALFSSIFLTNTSKMVSKGNMQEVASTYRAVVKWVSIVTVPVFLILFVFPRSALIFFGAEYYSVENALRILTVGFLMTSLTGPVSQIYQAVERTKLNFYTSVLVAVSNGALNFFLIPHSAWYGGVMGAAIASTVSFLLLAVVEIYLIYRILGVQPFRRSVFKIWAMGALSIGVVYALTNVVFDFTPSWFLPVALVVFGVVYAVGLLVARTLEEEDMVVLRAIRDKLGIDLDWLEDIVRRFS